MKTATNGTANLRCYDSPSGNGESRDVIPRAYASPEDVALHAEAKRRVQKSTPSLTNEQWSAWLTAVAARGGRVVLTLDGALAVYELESVPARHQSAATGQIE